MTPLSVVIPALNEAKKLPENVARLLEYKNVSEVIVVDGGSTDGTVEALESMCGGEPGRLKILSSNPGRPLQMNVGAGQATGEWLLFHHADSLLDRDAVEAISCLPSTCQWGGFEHSFDPNNWKLEVVSWLHNFRWRCTGVIYGDQSMFVRRSFFEALGGFMKSTLEDLEFSDRALEHSRSVLLPFKVRTDSRKFLQIGEFRALFQVFVILWRYERDRGVGVTEFFKPYR